MEVEIKKHLKKNFKLERKGLKLERQFENKEGSKGKEEKMCLFYASDYHFEMIILPYLNKKIEENNNVVIFTENNLKDTVNVLMSKMNFKEDRKNKILKLDWENDDLEKFEKLKNYEKDSKDTVVFIKGTENYIKNVNNNINEN